MHNFYVDFYHSWLIEVEPLEQGFAATCYSPCRQRILIQGLYASETEAFLAGKHQINYQIACAALAEALLDLYETERINFSDWRALSHSLH